MLSFKVQAAILLLLTGCADFGTREIPQNACVHEVSATDGVVTLRLKAWESDMTCDTWLHVVARREAEKPVLMRNVVLQKQEDGRACVPEGGRIWRGR